MAKLLVVMLLLVGCASTVTHTSVEERSDGVLIRTKTTLKAPRYALGESTLRLGDGGLVEAVLSPAQDEAKIRRVSARSKERLFQYGGCFLIIMLGFAFMYFKKTSTKLGWGMVATGAGMVAVVSFVDAASAIMAYVLPLLIVCGCVYAVVAWSNRDKG